MLVLTILLGSVGLAWIARSIRDRRARDGPTPTRKLTWMRGVGSAGLLAGSLALVSLFVAPSPISATSRVVDNGAEAFIAVAAGLSLTAAVTKATQRRTMGSARLRRVRRSSTFGLLGGAMRVFGVRAVMLPI